MPTIIDGTTGVDQIQNGTVTVNKIANGAVTEPKIATGAVTETKIADGAVTTAKLAAGVISTTSVLAAIAGAEAGAVGTYALARNTGSNLTIAFGATVSGSTLRRAAATIGGSGDIVWTNDNNAYAGTWRNMSAAVVSNQSSGMGFFLRIS
jgi:hypothetical protein